MPLPRKFLALSLAGAVIVVGAATLLYVLAFATNTPAYKGTRSVKIPRQASLEAVTDSLIATGILQRRSTFKTFARITGWGDQIKAGHYTIDSGSSNRDILDKLRKGLQSPIRLTVPPGSRPEVVAAVLARDMAFTADEFMTALEDSTLATTAGTDTLHLFGFMLPETYFFYWLTPPASVIKTVKAEFDKRYQSRIDTNSGFSAENIVNLASIVEWETGIVEEKARIAGVYLNRLRNRWRLQADPTVQYAILEREGSKRRLFFRDYNIEHPYNTYRFRGLPPGPVTNPSPSSIEAVLEPENHAYYYFVARGDGSHIFSRTLSEHSRNARNYRRLMQERRQQTSG